MGSGGKRQRALRKKRHNLHSAASGRFAPAAAPPETTVAVQGHDNARENALLEVGQAIVARGSLTADLLDRLRACCGAYSGPMLDVITEIYEGGG